MEASAIAALRGVERVREGEPSFGPVVLSAADEASGLATCFVKLTPSLEIAQPMLFAARSRTWHL